MVLLCAPIREELPQVTASTPQDSIKVHRDPVDGFRSLVANLCHHAVRSVDRVKIVIGYSTNVLLSHQIQDGIDIVISQSARCHVTESVVVGSTVTQVINDSLTHGRHFEECVLSWIRRIVPANTE